MATFRVVNPYIPIFVYKGKFFQLLEAAIRSAVIDFCADESMTYEKFVRTEKSSGTPFSARIVDINEHSAKAPEGIRKAFGIEVVEAWVHDFDIVPEDKQFADAARIEQIRKFEAGAAIQRAKGEAQARRLNAAAEGMRYKTLAASLTKLGVDPNMAAEIVGQQVRTENIRDSRLTTWVEGGGTAVPTIPLKGEE